jgi:hypothetical protein
MQRLEHRHPEAPGWWRLATIHFHDHYVASLGTTTAHDPQSIVQPAIQCCHNWRSYNSSLSPTFTSVMFTTFVGIGIYRGSWNCPNKYNYSLVITAQGGHDPGKLYNLLMTDEGRIVVSREVKVTSGAGPLPNLTHLGIFQACSTPYNPSSIVAYVRDLQIGHSDFFDQVVMHMVASNIANATRQWAGGSQVSIQHEFPNDLFLGSTESKRNVRLMRGKLGWIGNYCRYWSMAAAGR